jgi:hypothetical protein
VSAPFSFPWQNQGREVSSPSKKTDARANGFRASASVLNPLLFGAESKKKECLRYASFKI